MNTTKQWMLAAILTLCGTMSGFAQTLQGEAGKWTFIGQLTNPEDTLWALPGDNLKDMNVLVKENGLFKFTTDLTKAKSFFFVTPSRLRGEGGFAFVATAIPGEVLKAEGFCDEEKPADGLTYSGTKFYQYYTEINTINGKVNEGKDAQPAIDFIKTHPDCEAAVLFVNTVGIEVPDRLDETLSLLSPEIRNGRLKEFIESEVEGAKEYLRQKEMEGKVLPMGSMAPEFTLNDLNGQPLALSSLRGKYVVLDFWGSWCGWCIKGFPEMKKYYEKYKDKMEILGMDCNDTEAKWKKAVADNELPWKHVFVPRDTQILTDYLVNAFPTKIIISPEGKVMTTIVGEDPQFYEILDGMFAE